MKALPVLLCLVLAGKVILAYPSHSEGDAPTLIGPDSEPDSISTSSNISDDDSDYNSSDESDYSSTDEDDYISSDESDYSFSDESDYSSSDESDYNSSDERDSEYNDSYYHNDSNQDKNSHNNEILDEEESVGVHADALDSVALQKLVKEFTDSVSGTFNLSEAITRLEDLEYNIQRSVHVFDMEAQKENQTFTQLRLLAKKVAGIKNRISDLTKQFENLANGNLEEISAGSISGFQTSYAMLFRNLEHSGLTEVLDFRNCELNEGCCKNLLKLDNDSQSINTHDTCVEMFSDRNCSGESVKYHPSSPDHSDFGRYNRVFSSGKPCFATYKN